MVRVLCESFTCKSNRNGECGAEIIILKNGDIDLKCQQQEHIPGKGKEDGK